jgi:hypothetical protein
MVLQVMWIEIIYIFEIQFMSIYDFYECVAIIRGVWGDGQVQGSVGRLMC